MGYDNCYVNIDHSDLEAVKKSLLADRISGKSETVENYEKLLRKFFNSSFAMSCSNGTLAIQMVLMLNKVSSGDEVILPSTAPVMSALPIINLGAKPIFVDTERNNFNIDLNDLNNKISDKTKLLINVPMWGYANNIDKIIEVCQNHNIKVLEDNSHCHGSILKNQFLGNFGDYAIFSTHERKLITTGEGGFILIKNFNDYKELYQLRSFGESVKSSFNPYGQNFGLNYKLSGINAALGISQLKKLRQKIKIRTINAEKLSSQINSINKEIIELQKPKDSISNYYSIVFLAENKLKKELEYFLKKNSIISDPLRYGYCPLYKMPIFNEFIQNCIKSEILIDSVFTLPTHEGLKDKDIDKIVKLIRIFFDD